MGQARERISPRKTERFAIRLRPAQKALFQRAADLTGRSLSDFVLGATEAAAEETIRRHQVLELSSRDTEAFLEALESPPRLDPKTEQALRESSEHVRIKW